jgi:hypothetical protein
MEITFQGQKTTVRDWFTNLQDKVAHWATEARETEVPDFDETVSAHQSQTATPTSGRSSISLIKAFGVLPAHPKEYK